MIEDEINDLVIVKDLLRRAERVYGYNVYLDGAKNIIDRHISKGYDERILQNRADTLDGVKGVKGLFVRKSRTEFVKEGDNEEERNLF